MTTTTWIALILGIAVLVASAWSCVDEMRHAIDLDDLTDDGPDVLDQHLAETPLFAATVDAMPAAAPLVVGFADEVEAWLARGGEAS